MTQSGYCLRCSIEYSKGGCMNLIEIEENMSAICSEYNLIEGKEYDFIKKFPTIAPTKA